jgi:hypothetical protein
MGTPSEQIGFQASEEYTSRMSSPRPGSASLHRKTHSNASQTHFDSPLRKSSAADNGLEKEEFEQTLDRSLAAPSDHALESEVEDEDTIHVDNPERRNNKIYGGASHLASTEDLGPHGGNTDEEGGYSAPILAPDEVAKEPFGYELQPAVSPQHERRGSALDQEIYNHWRSGSASSSRPASIRDIPNLRTTDYDREAHSTPLEDLEEYEPLFPEDEKAASKPKPTTVEKLKRPDHRKFPSQDIWEDTPNSLQYTATVSTPQLPEENGDESKTRKLKIREGETPEQAFARRQEELAEAEASDSSSFLAREKKPRTHKPVNSQPKNHLAPESRSDSKQRFPSRDIWEDTPDSLQLQTTVAAPQEDEKDILSPPEDRPTTGAVVFHQDKSAAGIELGGDEGRATTGSAAFVKPQPQIPTRPTRSKPDIGQEEAQPTIPARPGQKAEAPAPPLASKPTIPERPKPQVPSRPSKPSHQDSSEDVPLSKVASAGSARSIGSDSSAGAAASKPKPPVPARPLGSKIAALQGGFLSDLNKRLQLGPQAPKKEEPAPEQPEEEKEKAPLADARKGRARGPARRAPPAAAKAAPATNAPTLSFSTPSTLWHIHPDDGAVKIAAHQDGSQSEIDPEAKALKSETPTLATNTAGQPVHEASEIAPGADLTSASTSSPIGDAAAREAETKKAEDIIENVGAGDVQPIKTSDSPVVGGDGAAEEEDLSASTATIKPESETAEPSEEKMPGSFE